mgnify:CR=1 FL=1
MELFKFLIDFILHIDRHLLELVRRDRSFGDDAARRKMIQIFDLLGSDHDLVRQYRRNLAAALH